MSENDIEKLDTLTFNSMLGVMLNGIWLLNDLEAYLRPFGLSQARLVILLAVQNSTTGKISPKELALVTGKSRPGISRLIDRLKEDGYLSSKKDSSDGRGCLLSLSAEGASFLNEIIPGYNKQILSLCSLLDDNDKRALIIALKKLNYSDSDRNLGKII